MNRRSFLKWGLAAVSSIPTLETVAKPKTPVSQPSPVCLDGARITIEIPDDLQTPEARPALQDAVQAAEGMDIPGLFLYDDFTTVRDGAYRLTSHSLSNLEILLPPFSGPKATLLANIHFSSSEEGQKLKSCMESIIANWNSPQAEDKKVTFAITGRQKTKDRIPKKTVEDWYNERNYAHSYVSYFRFIRINAVLGVLKEAEMERLPDPADMSEKVFDEDMDAVVRDLCDRYGG